MPMTMSAHQGEYGSQVKLMIADITAMTMPAKRAQALWSRTPAAYPALARAVP